MTRKQLDDFLNDYEVLCHKHKLFIDGCGCCNSPFVTTLEECVRVEVILEGETFEKALAENITHLREDLNSIIEEPEDKEPY